MGDAYIVVAKETGYESTPVTQGIVLRWDDVKGYLYATTETSHPPSTFAPLEIASDLALLGTLDIFHTATENDDHAVEIICDAAGFSDVKALDIDYITGALAALEDESVVLINIDETLSTGGRVSGFDVLSTTEGSAKIEGLFVGVGIHPIEQLSGVFVDGDTILVKASDQTVALSSGGGGNITLFVANTDTMTFGKSNKFEELEFLLSTGASGAGIKPTFEYSTGAGPTTWSTFGPTDGTNAFRNTGVIAWEDSDIPLWVVGDGSEFLIRITRTRSALTTKPVCDQVGFASANEFSWDKDALITAAGLSLTTGNLVVTAGDVTITAGNLTVGGTLGVTGITTFADNIVLGNGDKLVIHNTGELYKPAASVRVTLDSTGSQVFAIDTDNNSSGASYNWYKDAADAGGTLLMQLLENGNLTVSVGDAVITAGDLNMVAGDVLVDNVIGKTDEDSLLNLGVVSGGVQLQAAGSIVLNIDSDNDSTSQTLSVAKDAAGTTIMQIAESGILRLNFLTTAALQLPTLTTTQRDALTAVAGMILYNSTTGTFQGYDGAWKDLPA